ncbi:MAG: hypothetical protein JNL57_05265 [Bacteroidetes bacterium]|nr:hypothetical protein [Bacteroidota bacterium]
MPRFIYPSLLLLMLAACQPNTGTKTSADTAKTAGTNTPADSIAPASLKDTSLLLTAYAKDSLFISIGFQRAVNAMSLAYRDGNLATYISYLHPSVVKIYGGKDSTLARMKRRDAVNPVKFTRILSGPAKKVEAALDKDGFAHGWYCLMPVRSYRMENGKEVMDIRWLGGQTLDRGKTCHFIDITNVPNNDIYHILPDMRFVLEEEPGNP